MSEPRTFTGKELIKSATKHKDYSIILSPENLARWVVEIEKQAIKIGEVQERLRSAYDGR